MEGCLNEMEISTVADFIMDPLATPDPVLIDHVIECIKCQSEVIELVEICSYCDDYEEDDEDEDLDDNPCWFRSESEP